jgi:hypothetical protein
MTEPTSTGAQALAAYGEAMVQAWAAHEEARAQAWAVFEEAETKAKAAYNKAMAVEMPATKVATTKGSK